MNCEILFLVCVFMFPILQQKKNVSGVFGVFPSVCVCVCWTVVNGYTLAPWELRKQLNVCLKIDWAPSQVK